VGISTHYEQNATLDDKRLSGPLARQRRDYRLQLATNLRMLVLVQVFAYSQGKVICVSVFYVQACMIGGSSFYCTAVKMRFEQPLSLYLLLGSLPGLLLLVLARLTRGKHSHLPWVNYNDGEWFGRLRAKWRTATDIHGALSSSYHQVFSFLHDRFSCLMSKAVQSIKSLCSFRSRINHDPTSTIFRRLAHFSIRVRYHSFGN
jgi:hypothetical protein